MDKLAKSVIWMSNPAQPLRMVYLREELTDADKDLHNARVALKRFVAAGPSGDRRDVYDAMWKLQKKEQKYFATRYLDSNKAVMQGWYDQVSKYAIGNDKIGRGFQGTVFGVQGHPDKVAKKMKTFHALAHKSLTEKVFMFDSIASDKGFGPKVYEISYDGGRVMDISDHSTIPRFKRFRQFVVVMEKLREIPKKELESHYLGIVNAWKKMYTHRIQNLDGFYGYSSIHQAVVLADFGAVFQVKNDREFIRDLWGHFDSNRSAGHYEEEKIARKYQTQFPNEPFSQNILKPALDKLGP